MFKRRLARNENGKRAGIDCEDAANLSITIRVSFIRNIKEEALFFQYYAFVSKSYCVFLEQVYSEQTGALINYHSFVLILWFMFQDGNYTQGFDVIASARHAEG
jgi:hypothetical protein